MSGRPSFIGQNATEKSDQKVPLSVLSVNYSASCWEACVKYLSSFIEASVGQDFRAGRFSANNGCCFERGSEALDGRISYVETTTKKKTEFRITQTAISLSTRCTKFRSV